MIIYHGGTDIVEAPKIISAESGRDFGFGFYTTGIRGQAEKWAARQGRIRKKQAFLNIYEFDDSRAARELNVRTFTDYSAEWLEFIVGNRANPRVKHEFDIVYGKIANDDVGETVQAVVDGLMPLDFALKRLSFMIANDQYAFCTERSLPYITFSEYQKVG